MKMASIGLSIALSIAVATTVAMPPVANRSPWRSICDQGKGSKKARKAERPRWRQ